MKFILFVLLIYSTYANGFYLDDQDANYHPIEEPKISKFND